MRVVTEEHAKAALRLLRMRCPYHDALISLWEAYLTKSLADGHEAPINQMEKDVLGDAIEEAAHWNDDTQGSSGR